MRLLLTRAAEDASRTQAALAAKGHEIVVSPLIEIVATGACWPAGEWAAIVATSAKAFAMAPAIPAEQNRAVPLYLVGQRTKDAARRRGFEGPTTVAPDVAALLVSLEAEKGDPSRRFLYLAGRDRRPDVEDAFKESGQSALVVETYASREKGALTAEALSDLRDGRIDAVLHFSRRSAALFLAAIASEVVSPLDLTHLCLSEDVAAPLHDSRCRRLKTAKAPNEAALLSLLD